MLQPLRAPAAGPPALLASPFRLTWAPPQHPEGCVHVYACMHTCLCMHVSMRVYVCTCVHACGCMPLLPQFCSGCKVAFASTQRAILQTGGGSLRAKTWLQVPLDFFASVELKQEEVRCLRGMHSYDSRPPRTAGFPESSPSISHDLSEGLCCLPREGPAS